MSKTKKPEVVRTNDEIRNLLLRYFYDRNKNATSAMGKKGSAVKISDVKAELKAQHGLSQQEAQSNLTYLLSEGWVEEKQIQKQFRASGGSVIPSVTNFYQITARGIDKIEGPGEFTVPKFHGIRIEATGQNIITLGDGNQINAQFSELGQALVELRDAVTKSNAPEDQKMGVVADIDTIQSQLAKQQPNRSIVVAAWDSIKAAAAVNGFVELVHKISGLITPLFGH